MPPTGTVTFLFTDIEGSTKRWEHAPELMHAAFQRQEAIMREMIAAHGGYAYKMIGDAFQAAFQTAEPALAASIDAQRMLAAEPWGEIGPIRVRMALHTGVVEERADDYVGPVLNRVARLLAAGHGGQILLTAATQELVRDYLLPGILLRDMGQHHLKDLIRPEHVFQVVIPDLPSDFAPLKTLDLRRTNLPVQPTLLIGREQEVAALGGLLRRPDVRMVTLTGPGGIGKTRLALQAAADLADEFADGVYFVALAPITDTNLVEATIAQALGVLEAGSRPLLDRLKERLQPQHTLLLLDNFEQVLDAAPVVDELLAAAPQLKILVTSRTVLRIYGEREFVVPPLALPDPKLLLPLERLTQYEAVQLFVERAEAAKADFAVTNQNAPAVAEICARLDGLPLAIELAAARSKILSPQAMLARLSSRLKLLTGGARTLPARQQTLRGAIDWSYGLLDTDEQILFSRLSVFAGGCTIEAAEAVCNAENELTMDILDGMASLVDKSLLRQDAEGNDEPRFGMLETIREYAQERLAERREAQTQHARHTSFFLELVEVADRKLTGPDQKDWLQRLDREHENIRAALEWSIKSGDAETALRMAGPLWRFWLARGHVTEGRNWLDTALALPYDSAPRTRANALLGAGVLSKEQSDSIHATELCEESLALFQALGDKRGTARALNNLASVAADEGDTARAKPLYEESLALCRELGEKIGIAYALNNLGNVLFLDRDYTQAQTLLDESRIVFESIEFPQGIAAVLSSSGVLALLQGDLAGARAHLRRAIDLCLEIGDRDILEDALEALAGVVAAQGDAQRAARLYGVAAERRHEVGAPIPISDGLLLKPFLDAAREQIGPAAFDAALLEGRAMTPEQAIAYARQSW